MTRVNVALTLLSTLFALPAMGADRVFVEEAVAFLGDDDPSDDRAVYVKAALAGEVTGDARMDVVVIDGSFTHGGDDDSTHSMLVFDNPMNLDRSQAIAKLLFDDFDIDYNGIVNLGDTNGDGIDDIGVFEYKYPIGQQDLMLVFEGPLIGELTHADVDGYFNGNGNWESVLRPKGIGDINGDGFDDFATRLDVDDSFTGNVQIYFGPFTGANDLAEPNLSINGAQSGEGFGWAISAGDVNGDGHQDLAVGSQDYDHNGIEYVGAVRVFYGPLVGGSFTSEDADLIFRGVTTLESFYGVNILPDLNNDGMAEISIFGRTPVSRYISKPGSAHLFYSPHEPSNLRTEADVHVAGTHSIFYIDDSNIANLPDNFRGFQSAGDLNGDGRIDLAGSGSEAAGFVDGAYSANAGKGYLFYEFDSDFMPSSQADVILPSDSGISTGYDFLPLGDLDGDGRDELAVRHQGDNFLIVYTGKTLSR